MKRLLALTTALAMATPAFAEITIAHVYGKTGPFEAYAAQSHNGLMMGLEYATQGTMEVNGEKLVVIEKDTQLDPARG
jgi:branched-chain amino acid transport system substrate-binding protein